MLGGHKGAVSVAAGIGWSHYHPLLTPVSARVASADTARLLSIRQVPPKTRHPSARETRHRL